MDDNGTNEGTLSTTPAFTFTSMGEFARTALTTVSTLNKTRTFRAGVSVPFNVRVTVQNLDGTASVPTENKQITVTTTWTWQNENFSHQIMTTRRR
jgi:hypothetical protein